MNPLRLTLQIVLPVLVLAVSGLVAWGVVASKELPEPAPREETFPVVQVLTATTSSVHLTVPALGTVEPRTETQLVSEVSGRVEQVSSALASGGFFEQGELLLQIDATDYVAAIEDAGAAVARAEAALAREEADAEVARRDWESVSAGRQASPLVLHEPQLKEARANLASARARFAMAERDVERTEIRAPYEGRVRARHIDRGQFVTRGTALADIFAVDFAEVRLPISDDQLPLLNLEVGEQFGAARLGPKVTFRSNFAGKTNTWKGRIDRIEGAIDARTRSIVLVAKIEDPYGRQHEGTGSPLLAGLFVDATIEGRYLEGVVVLPRSALRSGETVWVLDDEDRLAIRETDLLSASSEKVIVSSGVRPGERVITSPLELAIVGMRLRAEEASE